MMLDIRGAGTAPSAFRSLPIFLSGALMDTINQLAAVFHLHMYHCPAATPQVAELRHRAERIVGGAQNKSVLLLQSGKPAAILEPPPRRFYGGGFSCTVLLTGGIREPRSNKFPWYLVGISRVFPSSCFERIA